MGFMGAYLPLISTMHACFCKVLAVFTLLDMAYLPLLADALHVKHREKKAQLLNSD